MSHRSSLNGLQTLAGKTYLNNDCYETFLLAVLYIDW